MRAVSSKACEALTSSSWSFCSFSGNPDERIRRCVQTQGAYERGCERWCRYLAFTLDVTLLDVVIFFMFLQNLAGVVQSIHDAYHSQDRILDLQTLTHYIRTKVLMHQMPNHSHTLTM
jgi:hypothetical protein